MVALSIAAPVVAEAEELRPMTPRGLAGQAETPRPTRPEVVVLVAARARTLGLPVTMVDVDNALRTTFDAAMSGATCPAPQ